MSTFKPSFQQARFYRWIKVGDGSAILEAVAGSGKTTTLIHGLGIMDGNVFFGAYNKKIADEIKLKAAEHGVARDGLTISTMHAAGFATFRNLYPKVRVEERKVEKIVDSMARDIDHIGMLPYKTFICKMVGFGKQFLMGVKRPMENLCVWTKLMDHFSARDDLPENTDINLVLDYVIRVSQASLRQCPTVIDFNDMIFAPIAFKARFAKYDWVLIDECQDLNGARRELAAQLLAPEGRLVAVGDSRQAIYGFTGAGADSVALIIKDFACKPLPLTVSYRCPKAVIAYVRQWVSHIEPHADAAEGTVRSYAPSFVMSPSELASDGSMAKKPDERPWYQQESMLPTDAILCRYTKPLVQTAYGMIRVGIACKVEGRDIGVGLIKLAQKWSVKTLDALDKRLEAHLAQASAKAEQQDDDAALTAVQDKVETLRIFMERCRAQGNHSIEALVAEIESLFADDVTGVCTLSTGHKAKGREWARVFWLQAALRNKRPMQAWEAEQEVNINYVIGTRVKQELVLVPEGLQ